MAFSKARRLSDFIAADGSIPTGKFASSTITSAHLVDGTIAPADLHTNMDLTGKTVLVANASTGDSDTTAANTAFVQQEIAALVDSSPSALNTLNELAAALGDDANFSTTVNNNIATKLPLAGGTLTGALIAKAVTLAPDTAGKLTIRLTTNAANDGRILLRSDTTDKVDIQANGDTYLNGGNVGIGTSSPSGNLEVRGSGSNGQIYLGGSTAGTYGKIYSDNDGTLILAADSGNNAGSSSFRVEVDGGEKLRVDSSGKVRIGATLGLNHLLNIQTASTSGLAQMEFRNTAAGTQIGMPANTNALSFFTADGERMRIDSSGDVRFAANATGAALIKGVSGNQTDRNTGGYPQFTFVGNEGTGMRRVSSNVLAFDNSGAESMRINADGYVSLNRHANEYGLELKSAGTRSGLVLKKPGTDSIMGSLLMMSDETLRLGTASVYNISMYQNGSVTNPNQPTAIYTHSTNSEDGAYGHDYGVTSGAASVYCRPQTAVVNRGSMYNASNGRFTAPVAGVYRYAVHGNLYTVGITSTAYWTVRMWKNTSHYIYHYEANQTRASGSWIYANVGGIIEMAANDYLRFQLVTNAKGGQNNYFGWDLANYTHYEFQLLY